MVQIFTPEMLQSIIVSFSLLCAIIYTFAFFGFLYLLYLKYWEQSIAYNTVSVDNTIEEVEDENSVYISIYEMCHWYVLVFFTTSLYFWGWLIFITYTPVSYPFLLICSTFTVLTGIIALSAILLFLVYVIVNA